MYYRKQLEDGGYAYYNGKYIRIGDAIIINPSEQMLLDNGYESYTPEVAPVMEPSVSDIMNALKSIQTDAVQELSDKEAVKVAALFSTWYSRIGTQVEAGERLWYDNSLFKCITPHEIQEQWNPKDAASLWQNVSEESQDADGSREHPFEWQSGMTSYNGKYYTENGILYLCIRDSGNPLYFPIASLIGTYFQIAD